MTPQGNISTAWAPKCVSVPQGAEDPEVGGDLKSALHASKGSEPAEGWGTTNETDPETDLGTTGGLSHTKVWRPTGTLGPKNVSGSHRRFVSHKRFLEPESQLGHQTGFVSYREFWGLQSGFGA